MNSASAPSPDHRPRAGRGRVLLALAAFSALVLGASIVITLLVALARYADRLV
jgi:hypothetical protein